MKSIVLFTMIGVLCGVCQANAAGFSEYPVQVYAGKKSPINYKSHTYAKQFKTIINRAYNAKKPDFAGYYSVASWGCGTACVEYAMIDRRNGKVSSLGDLAYEASEHGLSCDDVPDGMLYGGHTFYYKPNSRLLVEESFCATNEQGQEVYLNKYLLWNEKSKSFSLIDEGFVFR